MESRHDEGYSTHLNPRIGGFSGEYLVGCIGTFISKKIIGGLPTALGTGLCSRCHPRPPWKAE